MKTVVQSSPLIASTGLEGSVMGMDAAGMNTATYFMRDKIYSDKIGAVVREYACNAIDEHLKHDISEVVQIGIRIEDQENIFFVRDFAKGLSEDDIRNVFGMYFRSTKSGSNESIGGFGIGSKAGHCYSDSFYVASYFEGKKTTFACMLGGGETGVPVGHIYSVDSVDTMESGLEVSMPISTMDNVGFISSIQNFIRYSPANIQFLNYRDGSNPTPITGFPQTWEKTIEGYKFRLVKSGVCDSYYAKPSKTIRLQMGGVQYGTLDISPYKFSIKKDFELIVDLPIGSMSIPISRESFETTTANDNIRRRVIEIIEELSTEDLAQFKTKTLADLMSDSLNSASTDTSYVGDVFSMSKSQLFGDEWQFVTCLRQSNFGNSFVPEKDNQKFVLVVIPNNYAKNYWMSKVSDHSKLKNLNYYFILEEVLSKPQFDDIISGNFITKYAKKLPYDRKPRDKHRYAVSNYNGNIGPCTPQELNSIALRDLSISEPANEKDSIIAINKYINGCKELYDLAKITIANRRNYGKDNRIMYYCSSDKFVESLKEWGWLEMGSVEYRAAHDRIQLRITEDAKREDKIRKARKDWVILSKNTTKRTIKHDRNINRISGFWTSVLNEKSTRAKILIAFSTGYHKQLERHELRSILRLK